MEILENDYVIKGNITEIIVFNKHGKFIVEIETRDLKRVMGVNRVTVIKDSKTKDYYTAKVRLNKITVGLHRFLRGSAIKGHVIDHIDRNPLNNKMRNLRVLTEDDNKRNRRKQYNNKSGVRGVYWCTYHSKWRARIEWRKKRIHIGYFDDIKEAERAIISYQQAN